MSKKVNGFNTRCVYNSNCIKKNVEYEMIRPLSHSITIFRQVMNGNGQLSYAYTYPGYSGKRSLGYKK